MKEPKQNYDEFESEDKAIDENSLEHDEDDIEFEILQHDVYLLMRLCREMI